MLSALNREFTFFHGDLHIGNVLINTDRTRCKFFDFDFSGCLGRRKLENTKLLLAHCRDQPLYDRLYKLYIR